MANASSCSRRARSYSPLSLYRIARFVEEDCDVGMIWWQGPPHDGQRLRMQRHGTVVLPFVPVQALQVVEGGSDVGMIWWQGPPPDGQRLLMQRQGTVVLPLGPVQEDQVIEGGSEGGMIWWQGPLVDGQRLLRSLLGLAVLRPRSIQVRKCGQEVSNLGTGLGTR